MRKALPLLVILCLIFYACQKESDIQPSKPESTVPADEITALKAFLSEATGVEGSKIVFSVGEAFVIDGDVIMSLTNAREHYAKWQAGKSTSGRTEQRQYTFVMNSSVASNVTIYISPTVPAVWVTAIQQAVSNWNNTDTKIRASVTSVASGAGITITMNAGLGSNVIAQASFPDALGNCGPTVQINPAFNSLSASQKQFATTHEFGHCFGFMHTNQTNGTIITDTPVTDANSVMNSVVLNWNGFTFYDYVGFGVVYPYVSSTRRFLRYVNTGNGDHFYTIATGELGPAGSGGWLFEGSAGYIYPSAVAGTVGLHRFVNTSNGDHFYTTNFGEITTGPWIYEGIAGYVSPSATPGTRALHRFVNTSNGDHFYTLNFGEITSGPWIYEGVACYVW